MNIAFIEEVGKHSASKYAIDESYGDVVEPPTIASFLCVYRDTAYGCKCHAQIRCLRMQVAPQ